MNCVPYPLIATTPPVRTENSGSSRDLAKTLAPQHPMRGGHCSPSSASVLAKQIQRCLPLYAPCKFRPSFHQCGGRHAPQFAWFDLVQTAAVDAAFAAQLV